MSLEALDLSLLTKSVNWAYKTAVEGPRGLEPASSLAEAHHRPVQTSLQMADEIVGWQVARTSVANFFEDLDAKLAVPEDLPKALTTFLYLQLRISAAIAYGGGQELHSPLTKALVLSTLLGEQQASALEAISAPADFVATRSALKGLPADAASTLTDATLPKLLEALQDGGPLAIARTTVSAPWETTDLIQALGATARGTFIVLHHW